MLATPQARPGSRTLAGFLQPLIFSNILPQTQKMWFLILKTYAEVISGCSRSVCVSVTNISESHVGAGLNINPLITQWGLQLTEKHRHLWRPLLHALSRSWKLGGSSEKATKMVQFSSVAQSCPTLCDPMDCSTPGLPVRHQLPESTQTHVHWVGDAIQPSRPLLSSSPALNLSQHQGLFKWISSSHQVAKVLEFQLQHQSFQWIFKTDFLQDGYGTPNSGWITCIQISIHPSIHSLVHLSIHSFIHPPIHPTIYPLIHPSILKIDNGSTTVPTWHSALVLIFQKDYSTFTLVSLGFHNKYHKLDGLNNRNVFFTFWRLEVSIRMPTRLISGAFFLAHRWPPSLCVFT